MSAFIEPPSGNRGRIFYAFFDKNHLFALILKNGGTPPPHVDRLAELPYILFPSFSHNKVGIYAKQVKRAVTAVADRISQYLENKTVLANALLRRSKLHESVCKA